MFVSRKTLKAVPGLQRAVVSARWLWRLLRLWRSRNRAFLAYRAGHPHSPLPDYADVSWALANATAELGGLDLNVGAQIDLMRALAVYTMDHCLLEQPTEARRYHFENGFFTYPDALLLHAMLRYVRPRRVVEVGSGYSSALMLDTRDGFLDADTRFTFIDPEPRRLASMLRPGDRQQCTILNCRIQDVGFEPFLALEANDILFVDSSHVAKVGSDVNRIMFDVLPALQPGVWVHLHDIFWAFEYPAGWYTAGRAWNEAYLVRAFLQYNCAFEVMLFWSYLEQQRPDLIATLMPLARTRAGSSQNAGGSSLWLRKRAVAPT